MFAIHGAAGIIGSLLTGVFGRAARGGLGSDQSAAAQLWVQLRAVLIAIAWSAIGPAAPSLALDRIMVLRPAAEAKREGLNVSGHSERAYNY